MLRSTSKRTKSVGCVSDGPFQRDFFLPFSQDSLRRKATFAASSVARPISLYNLVSSSPVLRRRAGLRFVLAVPLKTLTVLSESTRISDSFVQNLRRRKKFPENSGGQKSQRILTIPSLS